MQDNRLIRTDDATDMPDESRVFDGLTKPVLRRLCALKKYQIEERVVSAKFFKRAHELEKAMESELNFVRNKRAAVVTGLHEPDDSECTLPLLHNITDEEAKKLDAIKEEEGEAIPSKGIPEFWLTVLTSSYDLMDWISESDHDVLKYLKDIISELTIDPPGFTLSFHFAENPYFTNAILKKSYTYAMEPSAEDPFDYDGPVIASGVGEKINWCEGMDLTQQSKRDISGKLINETSFKFVFKFFSPVPKMMSSKQNPISDDEEFDVIEDFMLGEAFRQKIIPNAVLYYTREMEEEEDELEDSDEDDDDDDEGGDEGGDVEMSE